jgi:hypothetical protein
MASRTRYTDKERAAQISGGNQAQSIGPMKVLRWLTPLEKTALREGFFAKQEEMLKLPAPQDIQKAMKFSYSVLC